MTTPENNTPERLADDLQPTILDDPNRIGGSAWLKSKLSGLSDSDAEDMTIGQRFAMLTDMVEGDINELDQIIEKALGDEVDQRRAAAVRVVLKLAKWYLLAEDLPRMTHIGTAHEVPTYAEAVRYADLHSRHVYGKANAQSHVQLDDVLGVYSTATIAVRTPDEYRL